MTVLVRAATLSNYAEVARQVGLDPRKMLRQLRIDPAALDNPDMRLPVSAVAALFEASAAQSRCESFGLRMAESRRLSDFGALGLLLKHQGTLREILAQMARYRRLLNEALAIHVEDFNDLTIIREELVSESGLPARQSYELAVGTTFRMFRALLGERWQAHSVHFTHIAPRDTGVHRRLFGPSLRFDSDFNGLVCAAADLDQPNPAADSVMASYAQRLVEAQPKAELGSTALDTRKAIYLALPLGKASIAQIARDLGFDVRTLQRRLDAETTSFSTLLNGARRDLAMRYLASGSHSMLQIAEMLGYSQLSSFTRWFSAEFGVPPTQWQANAAERRAAAVVAD
jgi:AraC-like DNA-binding protein